ncbi:MAG: HAD family hydrolase [Candidatus Omnitrophica bacterium]|nr:HAD family hydrolase [Candidatus Omnitrophota bacterium]
MRRKVIFIDRDGVINWDPIGDYIKKWDDFKFLDGVLEALYMLSAAGYEIIVISNQAGIGDGKYLKEDLDEITENMERVVRSYGAKITAGYYCLHGKDEGCTCRKPEIGLFEQAARDHSFIPQETYFIGDKISDIKAGKRFGLKTIMVMTGHGPLQKDSVDDSSRPDHIADDLMAAVHYILGFHKGEG